MPCSGLALKYQIDFRAGVIDRDYRGNVMILLDNTSDNPFEIKNGDRIAQMVLYHICHPPPEAEFIKRMEQAKPPETTSAQDKLKEEIGFSYHSVIGEYIWPMVKCCPDVAQHVIKQFLNYPKDHPRVALGQPHNISRNQHQRKLRWPRRL